MSPARCASSTRRAQRRQLGGVVAEVEVPAEAKLAVDFVAELSPARDRLLGERELRGVATLEPQRALRAAGALEGRLGFLLDQDHRRAAAGRGGGAGVAREAAADHDDVRARHATARRSIAATASSSISTPRPGPVATVSRPSTISGAGHVT